MSEAVLPGYRRRILIEPGPGTVTAELEDDYHRMVVTLAFANGVITKVDSGMKRSPWTTCPGAIAQLDATFRGERLDVAGVWEQKFDNCTHLFDLAVLAAVHAGEDRPTAYEAEISDPVDGTVDARLWRDGVPLYHWRYADWTFSAPEDMAGMSMKEIGRWIAEQPADLQEAARIMRWATMVGSGRGIDLAAGTSAKRFARGVCFTFKPAMAEIGTRRPAAAVDFTAIGIPPMMDREDMFERR